MAFKQEAIRLVKLGQSAGQVASTLSMPHQTLENWLRVDKAGKLTGAGDKVVTPEQMELTRLRAENARLKMERDILKKPRHISLKSYCEICLDTRTRPPLANMHNVPSAGCQ
jgi:transposase